MTRLIIIFIFAAFPLFSQINGNPGELLLNEISGPENYIPQPFDVKHYDAEIDLTKYPSTEMAGVCRMSIEWLGSPADNKFYFHLRDLTIDSVFYQNIPVDAIEVGTKEDPSYHFEVTPPPQLSTSSATVTVYYHGSMTLEYNTRTLKWGGVKYQNNVLFAMGVGFYNNYVSTTQHWLPCYDLPSDKATFKCKFIVPSAIFVASNGLLTGQGSIDTNEIYIWEHNNDCATYNYTFAASNYIPVNFGDGELPMVVYCKPEDTTNTRIVFKLLPDMVKAYEKRFGEYPFEKVGYVLTPTGSMEHETMISFAEKLVRFSKDTVNEVGAHELAHMWFGDMVTPYDFRDAWLNEGFATFCESIWYDELFGPDVYLKHQDDMRAFYISSPNGARYEGIFSLYDFPRSNASSNYPGTIYKKGGSVIGMLRYELGDSIFFEATREYINRAKYANVSTEFLKEVYEEVSGIDLDWFFDQWVYGKGWPQLEVEFENTGNGTYKLNFEQVQPDSFGIYTNVPVEVGFEDSGGEIEYRIFTLNQKEEVFYLVFGFDCNKININKGPSLRALLEVKEINIVSVEEDDMISDKLQLYPNPADSRIIVVFPAGDGFAYVTVYNEVGIKVLSDRTNTRKGNNYYNLNIREFASGNYFIMIENDGPSQRVFLHKEIFKVLH
ncbi:M1 family aminopeptidase [Bacteroidota bacterium]